ncbi:MAG: hypothetical protein LBU55_04545 [Elusimicrobiota bacterium]|jgi:hypothetical protein|nr:hypothetical protein [Elusimicrobiota bacterium]
MFKTQGYIKILLLSTLIFVCHSFGFTANNAPQRRRIVFFAETLDIPKSVVNKILDSKRFCLVVPVNSATGISENLEPLISCGKAEPALSLLNEPILPVVASFSNSILKNRDKHNIFHSYISGYTENFDEKINKKRFGIFLKFAVVSEEIVEYFGKSKISWVNAKNLYANTGEFLNGAFVCGETVVFAPYENFPDKQVEVMSWLEKRKEKIIPVVLKEKHIQNYAFMEYLIDVFDNSVYIKPAIPLFILFMEKETLVKGNFSFKSFPLSSAVMDKIDSAVSAIESCKDDSSFAYENAKSELIQLCSGDIIKEVMNANDNAINMFNVTYSNILRLLQITQPASKVTQRPSWSEKKEEKRVVWSNSETSVKDVSDGIIISNKGLINSIKIVKTAKKAEKLNMNEEYIKVTFSFSGLANDIWSNKISFVDFYIDLNYIDDVGNTSTFKDVGGFLSPDSAWEYALRVTERRATLYRSNPDGPKVIVDIPVSGASFFVPSKYIRGNPVNWGYQAMAISKHDKNIEILDILNQNIKKKSVILSTKPLVMSAVRLKH